MKLGDKRKWTKTLHHKPQTTTNNTSTPTPETARVVLRRVKGLRPKTASSTSSANHKRTGNQEDRVSVSLVACGEEELQDSFRTMGIKAVEINFEQPHKIPRTIRGRSRKP
ncbi:hypothetical protein Tco_1102875 [Tanacetum coccineum]